MMEWWGPVIWETYGGMEGAATIAKPYRWLEKPGTVGRSVAGMKVKILDDDGNELRRGEVGQVYLEPERGSSFAYKDDPELTASVSRGQAFTLGDIGLHGRGRLFVHPRPGQGHDHQRWGERLPGGSRGRPRRATPRWVTSP